MINFVVQESAEKPPQASRLSEWADHEIEALRGTHVARSVVAGPPIEGASGAVFVVMDQPALGEPGQALSIAMLLWHFKGRDFGAELTFNAGDDGGKRYKRTLLEVMRSFKPIGGLTSLSSPQARVRNEGSSQ